MSNRYRNPIFNFEQNKLREINKQLHNWICCKTRTLFNTFLRVTCPQICSSYDDNPSKTKSCLEYTKKPVIYALILSKAIRYAPSLYFVSDFRKIIQFTQVFPPSHFHLPNLLFSTPVSSPDVIGKVEFLLPLRLLLRLIKKLASAVDFQPLLFVRGCEIFCGNSLREKKFRTYSAFLIKEIF